MLDVKPGKLCLGFNVFTLIEKLYKERCLLHCAQCDATDISRKQLSLDLAFFSENCDRYCDSDFVACIQRLLL